MRKSSAIIVLILLAGFGGLLMAANKALEPLAKDADVARDLTAVLANRGDLAEGSRVKALRVQGGEKRLADEGRGLQLILRPSLSVKQRRGGLGHLARRAAVGALERYPAGRLDWVELTLVMDEEVPEKDLRALIRIGAEGQLSAAEPALPALAPGVEPAPRRRPAPRPKRPASPPPTPVDGDGAAPPAKAG